MELAMKIFFCLTFIIVAVSGERERRQSWRGGLWGRELLLENAKRKDAAAVLDILKNRMPHENFQSGSETGEQDGLKNEVQDFGVPLTKVFGQERSKFKFLHYPKHRQESQEE